MRKKLLAGLATGLFLIGIAGIANAIPIIVSQGGTILGNIESYSGSLTGSDNYYYYNASNHVVNGPTALNKQGQIFFYEGSDGLSFNTIFSSVGGSQSSSVNWDITIAGSTTNPSVLASDDPTELTESGTDNIFNGRWNYIQQYGDGGVIGELGGNMWSVTVDQLSYSNINSLMAYGTTNSISLALDTTQDITFTVASNPAPVPEPATILLMGFGLLGLGIVGRKKLANKTS